MGQENVLASVGGQRTKEVNHEKEVHHRAVNQFNILVLGISQGGLLRAVGCFEGG